jgi:Zn-dependent protease with chaperone function
MNFFEHQDRARRETLWLILLFSLAVLTIVVVMDLLALFLLGGGDINPAMTGGTANELLSGNAGLLTGTTVATLGVILLASLYRITSLRSGGSAVATELGGVLVSADVQDPLRRRLRNVVEEIALASGIPVPDIYVLEQESAINAFAAGYSPADAAVAVTRGTLEKLNREELQGVIAHEFSHILNGDMRLNIRLMGIIFGILMMSVIGRHLLHASSFRSRSSSKSGGGIVIIAIGVMVIGYVGLFFGNLIKAAVSRRREFLADASAVQFTRNPDGIAGALKRIAIDADADALSVDAGEVSHMLFSGNSLSSLMATHPPLIERIQRIQPDFQEQELVDLTQRVVRHAAFDAEQRAKRSAGAGVDAGDAKPGFAFGSILGNIGNPNQQQLLYAALLSASFPDAIQQAAHSPEWAPEVLCLILLDRDPAIRERQLLIIATELGEESERQCRYLAAQLPEIKPGQRLPLAELCLPALKRRPRADLERLDQTIDALIAADGKVALFEYAIGRLLRTHLHDALDPSRARNHGNRSLQRLQAEAVALLHTVATIGHQDPASIDAALAAGLAQAGIETTAAPTVPGNWQQVLDRTLEPLDRLKPKAKQALIDGLFATVTYDHQVTLEETEILRAICAALHVPLPLLQSH